MNIILNSGAVLHDVQPLDRNRSPIGLLSWATKQASDRMLSFENLHLKASSIAGFQFTPEEQAHYDRLYQEQKVKEYVNDHNS